MPSGSGAALLQPQRIGRKGGRGKGEGGRGKGEGGWRAVSSLAAPGGAPIRVEILISRRLFSAGSVSTLTMTFRLLQCPGANSSPWPQGRQSAPQKDSPNSDPGSVFRRHSFQSLFCAKDCEVVGGGAVLAERSRMRKPWGAPGCLPAGAGSALAAASPDVDAGWGASVSKTTITRDQDGARGGGGATF